MADPETLNWHALTDALRDLRGQLVVVGIGGEGVTEPEQMTLTAFGRLDVEDRDRFVLMLGEGPRALRIATLNVPRERFVVAARARDGFVSIAMRDLNIVVFPRGEDD